MLMRHASLRFALAAGLMFSAHSAMADEAATLETAIVQPPAAAPASWL